MTRSPSPLIILLRLAKGCALLALSALPLSCGAGDPAAPQGGPFVPDAAVVPIMIPATCTPARASENLRPRADLTAVGVATTSNVQMVRTADLFTRFNASCGTCHVATGNGGRQVSAATFATVFDASWLVPVESNDPAVYMPPPPNGAPFSSRKMGDPIFDLDTLLHEWINQGQPSDMFTDNSGGGMATNMPATASYLFTPDMAATMTNLGNCIPPPSEYATSSPGIMESMDAVFAGAMLMTDPSTGIVTTTLPTSLAGTDLTSFDSETLAATGVIAYVPTYPLWSDGSNKLRYVRVPKGQTIKFDKATQTFDIPENTRFYKTFLRQVIDKAGVASNRKMETRLIVVRKDTTNPDGTAHQNALFATYVWSDDETMATTSNQMPYNDLTGFQDQTEPYYTDELAYQNIVNSIGPGAGKFADQLAAALADYKTTLALAGKPDILQNYAIPGSIRCTQCHMGSPSQDFILGFTPLQIARRANGTGGTYEPTGDDELTQLQRLIDYGVISGMTSPADVLPLEESEGTRKPRTDAELNAQAYMVGNCAHCHNPRGLPSVTKPELATAINFLPGPDLNHGVFEFPFDAISPIRSRGANGDISIPYITPSLRDYPVIDQSLHRMDDGAFDYNGLDANGHTPGVVTYSPKYVPSYFTSGVAEGAVTCSDVATDTNLASSPNYRAFCGERTTGYSFVPAPWRSLIYRNVDTPYAYFDDFVPFPHMPMNTPGFDCRVPRIMGDWMVGLPAVRKNPQLREDALPSDWTKPAEGSYDNSPQPYQEVKRGDPGYADALALAQDRLDEYHAGVRYGYCQDVLSPDIFDTDPGAAPGQYVPDPEYYLFSTGQPPLDPTNRSQVVQPAIGVPYHVNWYNDDPTNRPIWQPRRTGWRDILVDGTVDTALPANVLNLAGTTIPTDRARLAEALNEATLSSDLITYATTPLPMGLWQVEPACTQQLAGQMTASAFSDSDGTRPQWMDKVNPPPEAPVYISTPGEALYRNICFNCHGPNKDGKGIQADLLAATSMGNARPADFRDGLFGPVTQPGNNLLTEFTVAAAPDAGTPAIDAVGWAARYLSWMTLGGTLQKIPQDIINLVQATRIFGQARSNLQYLPTAVDGSANMLNLAKGLCSIVLPEPGAHYHTNSSLIGGTISVYPPYNAADTPFIDTNGDKEMWLHLCAQFSPTVIRVYQPVINQSAGTYDAVLNGLYYGDPSPAAGGNSAYPGYPVGAPILDQNFMQREFMPPKAGDPAFNYYPACFDTNAVPAGTTFLSKTPILTSVMTGPNKHDPMPPCPPDFLQNAKVLWRQGNVSAAYEDNAAIWELRGAIATGMTVFSQLNPLNPQSKNDNAQTPVPPYYNECQLLKN